MEPRALTQYRSACRGRVPTDGLIPVAVGITHTHRHGDDMRTCTIDGCDKRHRARGLCTMHYNRAHQPNRHRPVEAPCALCGKVTLRSRGGGRVHGHTCSNDCRAALSRPTCQLPDDHISRWIGQACEWTPPPAKARPARFVSGRCIECTTWFVAETFGSAIEYCSTRCARRTAKRRRRAREAGAPGEYRYAEVLKQYRRQGSVCAYCTETVVGLPEPEHVLPLSRGGRNDASNLVAACRQCNTDKGDLTLDEWRADRARRGLAPVRTELLSVPGFSHLATFPPTRAAHRHRLLAAA